MATDTRPDAFLLGHYHLDASLKKRWVLLHPEQYATYGKWVATTSRRTDEPDLKAEEAPKN